MNTVQLRAGQTSQPFPVGIGSIVTITPASIGGGTGYIEYSLSSTVDISNNLGVWLRWPKGSVAVATSDTAMFVFVARAVCTAGNATFVLNDPTSSTALNSIPWASNEPFYQFDANGVFIGLNGPGNSTSPTPALLWAQRPTPSAANAGQTYRFIDVGGGTGNLGGGNFFFSTGTSIKLQNGNCLIDSVDTANSGTATTAEENLNPNHIALPAGVSRNFDRFRLRMSLSKNGAAANVTIRVRFGPLGTIADPILATITTLAGTNQSAGYLLDFKRASATSMQKLGNADTSLSYSGAVAGAYPAAVTGLSNMDSTAMFLSLTSQLDAATEIVTLQDYTFELYETDSV